MKWVLRSVAAFVAWVFASLLAYAWATAGLPNNYGDFVACVFTNVLCVAIVGGAVYVFFRPEEFGA